MYEFETFFCFYPECLMPHHLSWRPQQNYDAQQYAARKILFNFAPASCPRHFVVPLQLHIGEACILHEILDLVLAPVVGNAWQHLIEDDGSEVAEAECPDEAEVSNPAQTTPQGEPKYRGRQNRQESYS